MGVNLRPTGKCQIKLQSLKWTLETGSTSESVPIGSYAKMPNCTAEMDMFSAWSRETVLVSVVDFLLQDIFF